MSDRFAEIKGKLGFGMLRLPHKNGDVNYELLNQMVDHYLANGFNYFDTAHLYMKGQSETAVKRCIVDRHPRSSFLIGDKLTYNCFKEEKDILPLFELQLKNCGLEYFDFYLLHAVTVKRHEKYKKNHAYDIIKRLKADGKIRHWGISFHDRADVLDEILNEYPDIELVQIQFNYVDYEDVTVQSRKVYEVCKKHNKPIFVMEPIKGGGLIKLPPEGQEIFDNLNKKNSTLLSNASFAIRYAAGFEQIVMVLSGMSDMEQVIDNVSYMKAFKPLSNEESAAVEKVKEIFLSKHMIACTACRYCTDDCPMNIPIPDLFSCLNEKKVFNNWNQNYYYHNVLTASGGKASSCIRCGKCERHCPQKLPIRNLLSEVADEFEKKIYNIKIKDIPTGTKYYDAAAWSIQNKITYLDKSNNFFPKRQMTKLEVAVFLWRFCGRPSVKKRKTSINDLKSDFVFRDAVQWVVDNNYLCLDKNLNINLSKKVTRLDLLVYIWRLSGRPRPENSELKINDYENPSFVSAVQWCIEKHITYLDKSGKVYPKRAVDRLTAVVLIYRAKKYLKRSSLSNRHN